ncbi:tetratricopeptide repeat protein [Tolypothrix campylonemoides VB511288_2]|uniref:Tetratricopeptide repeat protein n=1 Tax=Tolypothrix campylonemoides VB511288_2 TaxID=3232311 RepID=A0ABW8XD80_9CYAN
MSQSRNRWMVNAVLLLAVLAFVGVSMIPLIAAFNDTQPSRQESSSNRSSSTSSDEKTNLEDAARGYEQVLQREPDNETALRGLIETRLQLIRLKGSNIKEVIEPLERLAKLKPKQTRYAVLLAQAKHQIGDREGAAQVFRSVLENKPGDLDALQGMVALLLDQKRPEAAIGLLQDTLNTAAQANKIQPGSVDTVAVQVLLGCVYDSQKKYAQALNVYDRAIKNDKQDFRPVLAKAMLLKKQGKTEEAKLLFTRAAALAPAQYKDEINKEAATSSSPVPSTTASPTPEG